MTIGLLKEPAYETRVSLLAEATAALIKKGITVLAEAGAGTGSAAIAIGYAISRAGLGGTNNSTPARCACSMS